MKAYISAPAVYLRSMFRSYILIAATFFAVALPAVDACVVHHVETRVIHHEAQGHYEIVWVWVEHCEIDEYGNEYYWAEWIEETIWVEDVPAWDETIIEEWDEEVPGECQ